MVETGWIIIVIINDGVSEIDKKKKKTTKVQKPHHNTFDSSSYLISIESIIYCKVCVIVTLLVAILHCWLVMGEVVCNKKDENKKLQCVLLN